MKAQDVILGSRVAHVRELKSEVARLKEENAQLREANAELLAHFDLALLAASDLARLSPGGRMVVWDGWNLIRGAPSLARDPADLEAQARIHLESHPLDFIWIVYDGEREGVKCDGWLRLSWTGGKGAQRADRFICDFVRAARFRGDVGRLEVRTRDKALSAAVERLVRLVRPRVN